MNLVNKHKLNSIKPTPLSFGEGPGVRLFSARYVACPDERGNSVPIAIGIRVWLSVDPMADKNFGISPYNYCHWNPLKMIDPDGLDDFTVDSKTGQICKMEDQSHAIPGKDRLIIVGSDGKVEYNKRGKLQNASIMVDEGRIN